MQDSRKNEKNDYGKSVKMTTVNSLGDLINLNLRTLESVNDGLIDNRKAALIFTGSRTVTAGLKVGVEAMRLGMSNVAGLPMLVGIDDDGDEKDS